VAGGRDHSELGVGDELNGVNGVFKADKIAVSQNDEKGRFDGSQFFLRKSLPLNASKFVKHFGPVVWIGSHFFVVFSLKLDVFGISRRRVLKVRQKGPLRLLQRTRTGICT